MRKSHLSRYIFSLPKFLPWQIFTTNIRAIGNFSSHTLRNTNNTNNIIHTSNISNISTINNIRETLNYFIRSQANDILDWTDYSSIILVGIYICIFFESPEDFFLSLATSRAQLIFLLPNRLCVFDSALGKIVYYFLAFCFYFAKL